MRILCHIKSVIDVYITRRFKHYTARPAGDFGDRQVFRESGKGVNPFTSDGTHRGYYAFVHDARPRRYKIEGEKKKMIIEKYEMIKYIMLARHISEYIIVVCTYTRATLHVQEVLYTFGTII